MAVIDNIFAELDDTYITKNVRIKHDEARTSYHRRIVTVADDTEFDDIVAEYYSHHFAYAVAPGARLQRAEAAGRAKEIIERNYRRFQKDRLDAYTDGKSGNNGGMRAILDIIMEHMKMEAVEYHIRDVFDRYVKPTDFNEQVEIVRQVINRIGPMPGIDASNPERYARNYEELIRGIADAINKQAARFRRL